MFVKVYKLGEEEDVVTVFPVGAHTIGRGPTLQCNDKRVSRNHATIEVTQDDVKIISNHINPCFLKMANSKTITILSKDSASQLKDGDTFAFLPDVFWFKIKIVEDEDAVESAEAKEKINEEQTLKRPLNDSENETPDKRKKIEDENNCENVSNGEQVETKSDALEDVSNNQNQVNEEIKLDDNQEPEAVALEDNVQINVIKDEKDEITSDSVNTSKEVPQDEEEIKGEPSSEDKADDEANAGTSNPKPRRERCWYGATCYRKNPLHRDDFSHPGDSDFESDPDDNRPVCSFGATCYRKNKSHRREYKHPPRQPSNPLKTKRTRKKVHRPGVIDDDDLSEMSEDPFIADDDSDEYVEDSDDDDTEWEEDSQNVDEDSENMKRLVKEAKKFIKK